MKESSLADIFPLLDMAVMELTEDGVFRILGDVPGCLSNFLPKPHPETGILRPEENFPFLENFLFDAEEHWVKKTVGSLKSGIWTETNSEGEEIELEAAALCLGERKILLIEPARYSYEEKQSVIQKSRELSLAYHRLEQTEVELKRAKEAAEDANRKIMSSIQYAKSIQYSLLPDMEEINVRLPDSFFLWMPRDIVGGDIFFADFFDDGFIIAVVDCTGHGIPGAFMTMIASSGLKQIIRNEGCRNPGEILKRLNFMVKTLLRQDTAHTLSDDGLDAAVVSVRYPAEDSLPKGKSEHSSGGLPDTAEYSLTFSGARLSFLYICNGELFLVKGDRQSIGYKRSDLNFNFNNHSITLGKGASCYMFTDGFQDQMGGERRLRFGSKKFRHLLGKIARLPFEQQRSALLRAFDAYKGENERQDDVTVLGFGF